MKFILFIRDLSPEKITCDKKKWHAWLVDLEHEFKSVQCDSLMINGLKIFGPEKSVKDFGFNIQENASYFIQLRAGNIDEVAQAALKCPCLEAGGSITIRPVVGSS